MHLDLHHALRAAPAYRIREDDLWRASELKTIASVSTRALADEHLLLLLAVSITEDAGFGMAKLKQVADLWLLARDVDAHFDWDTWFERRGAEHMRSLTANGLALTLDALDALEEAPRLAAALARQHDVIVTRGATAARTLIGASRDDPPAMAWFRHAYPGSLALYRAHSFAAGFPGTLRELRPSRLRADARAMRGRA